MAKLTDAERSMLFRCEERLRAAKNMLAAFGAVVRGGMGPGPDGLRGTELHTLIADLDKLEDEISTLAMETNR